MKTDRTAACGPGRAGLLGRVVTVASGLTTACLLVAGCDSAVGLPADPTGHTGTSVATSTTPVPPAPGSPEAARVAVERWAADLRGNGIGGLTTACWAMAPSNIATMYADPAPIFDALTRPAADAGDTTVWRNDAVTVVATDADTADGYACPHVFTAGSAIEFNDADARHTVRRYLSRMIGDPVHTDDVESAYPLVCSAADRTWDPNNSGRPGVPPMAAAAGKLPGIRKFADESIKSEWPRSGYITVTVPVTSSTGVAKKQTFTLKSGNQGYCIGDVSG